MALDGHAKLAAQIAGPVFFVLIILFVHPEGLSNEANCVLAATAWIAIWWVTEAIPIAATALLPVVLFPLTGAVTLQATTAQYGHRYIFLYIGGFLLAIAIEKWGLHRRIALSIPQTDHSGVSALVTHLQSNIAQHAIPTSHGPVAVTLAAGCVTGDDHQPEVEGSAARHALNEAMSCGVGCIRFAEETGIAARERDDIVAAAQIAMGAIRSGDLVIAYQPVVSASGNNRTAFHECLVRVREPSGNLIAAAKFMPAMEQLGLATLIDRQVLVMALEALTHV